MKSFLITFRSITVAQRAQKALERQEIHSNLRRTPRWMEERGCGYGLEVKVAEPESVTALLEQQGIPYRKVYRIGADGTVEGREL